ncbi:MAG: type II toxin-antitoxin system prevent-host-death family antitoxin [Gammaproteobacteria bacterium]|nr:type II toxin-antitoxin system prevent-host-death family antitoxin [Gammaproteobacteria bacterium]
MRTLKINEAEASLSALLAVVEAGDEVAITRYGRVVARLIPGTRHTTGTPQPPRWGDSSTVLESQSAIETGLLAPLD